MKDKLLEVLTKNTAQHMAVRTSPKGEQFIGTCTKCGKTGLTTKTVNQNCPGRSTAE